MPYFNTFKGANHYYATAFHELTHWTGHPRRLNREYGKKFGDKTYAFEELIAELGAAFLCAEKGVTGDLRHAGYIKSWLHHLKNDPKYIAQAAAKAAAAVQFIKSGEGVAEQHTAETTTATHKAA